jgi:hypothetical protein
MFGAISGPARRNDLGLRIHEFSHKQGVLIINSIDVIGAEVARLFYDWLGLLVHNALCQNFFVAWR